MASYASVAQYKARSHVLSSVATNAPYDDATLQGFLDASTAYIDSQIYQPIGSSVDTETYRVGSIWCHVSKDLVLQIVPKQYPVISVTSIAYRFDPSTSWSTASTFTSTQYSIEDTLIAVSIPSANPFFRGLWGEVQLTYTHGYATIPADIVQVCIIYASLSAALGYAAVDLHDGSARQIISDQQIKFCEQVLDRYQRRF